MGKKTNNQDPAAKLNGVANRDITERINFLYQASTYLSTISQPPIGNASSQRHNSTPEKPKRNKIRHPSSTSELSKCYVRSLRIVGQKTMVRVDPSMKRALCKQCDAVLLPGSTSSVRIKSSHGHGQIVRCTCLSCGNSRSIPAPPVLDPTSAADTSALSTALNPASSSSVSAIPTGAISDMMPVDSPSEEACVSPRGRRRRPAPRNPPFFERPGHVVFQGNEVVRPTS